MIESLLDAPPPNVFERYGGVTRRVHAVQATTGIGKTRIAVAVIARRIRDGRLTAPVGYAVPTHRLGEDIAKQFRDHGITAEVWRGRKAFISGKSGPTMCEDLGTIKIAEDMGAVIETSCCKGEDPDGNTATCPYYNHCAYQRQKSKNPDVWIFAHQMLFQKNTTLKGMSVIFIDESFRDAGTTKPVKGLTLDEIEAVPLGSDALGVYRSMLGNALRAQAENGGVPGKNLEAAGLGIAECTRAISLEWARKEKRPTLWPGMPTTLRAAAAKAGSNTKFIRTFHRVWSAARELLEHNDDVASGRMFMANHKTENGVVRVVRTRGIRKVAEQYLVPTFIMDATLPDKSILEKWFPDVEVVGNIEVPMPHVNVRQVLGAPVSKKKLESERNLKAVRRLVLQRHIETGRGKVLVVAQKDIETALKAKGLPPTIAVEHFNAIAGLDEHKDVGLLITLGRTQPEPAAVEEDAGALSGVEPVKASLKPNQSRWYDKKVRGVRLRDGSGVAVSADQHPDPLAEAVRQQICEAELVQAVGRGRGVNRGPENPLAVDIVGDVVLPLTVDQVVEWQAPSLEVEMAIEGIWLESPADMSRAWPAVWATPQAAKDWQRKHTVVFPLIEESYQGLVYRVVYQRPGERQNPAWVDPGVVPDPRAWLEARLGPLAGFEIVVIRFTLKANDFALGGLDFATPPLTVRPSPHQKMCSAIDAQPPEYFAGFGSTKESWQDWRAGGEGTHSGSEGQEKLAWFTPVVEEIFPTPEELAALWKLPSVIEGAAPLA
jgi:hypothetical protein